MRMHVSGYIGRGQRTIWERWFSPSTMRIQEIELRSSGMWQVPVYIYAIKKLEGKNLVSRGQGRLEQNHVFWTWQDPCTHELTAAVVAKIRPAQDQPVNTPAWCGKRFPSPPPLTEELLIVDGF